MSPTEERRTICGPGELFAAADKRVAELGCASFSEYIRCLIRYDSSHQAQALEEALRDPAIQRIALVAWDTLKTLRKLTQDR